MFDGGVDYKQMYLIMVRASEAAINVLIQAQRQCEDLYLRDATSEDPAVTAPVIPFSPRATDGE